LRICERHGEYDKQFARGENLGQTSALPMEARGADENQYAICRVPSSRKTRTGRVTRREKKDQWGVGAESGGELLGRSIVPQRNIKTIADLSENY